MRRLVLVGVLAVILVLAMAVPAMAKSGKPKHSKMVLNITYKVTNYPDSGLADGLAGYGTSDALNRHVKVWRTQDGSYYVVAKDHGKWKPVEGMTTPGDLAVTQGADATGLVHGGYTATLPITDLLNAKNGNLGTFDYQVDTFDWLANYFPTNSGLTYLDWAWTYMFQGQKWVNTMPETPTIVATP